MDELVIGTAEAGEADEVAALVQRAYRGPESLTGWTSEANLLTDDRIDRERVLEKISPPDAVVLTVRGAENELIACCELAWRGAGVCYFGMFAVRPDLQSAGLGRRVLAAAEGVAVERWGASCMEMTVIAQRDELIGWYERRGYRRTDEQRPFPFADLRNGAALRDDLYFVVLVKDLVS